MKDDVVSWLEEFLVVICKMLLLLLGVVLFTEYIHYFWFACKEDFASKLVHIPYQRFGAFASLC